MRYNKQFDDTGKLIAIGTGAGGEEITKEEYDRLLSEIRAKAAYEDAVYADPAAISTVPPEWQEEILARVEARKTAEANPPKTVEDRVAALEAALIGGI